MQKRTSAGSPGSSPSWPVHPGVESIHMSCDTAALAASSRGPNTSSPSAPNVTPQRTPIKPDVKQLLQVS